NNENLEAMSFLREMNGFSEPSLVTDRAIDSAVWSLQAVIVARGPEAEEHVGGTAGELVVFGKADDALAETLRRRGADVAIVSAGDSYAIVDGQHFTIDPQRPE